ncbi:putative serine/threonine-protein kinase nek2 [Cucumis melo var. makuwa]|uniref:Putative serine/threonine-protein kinase nek2 n=1 Tax=Cucumis melo var. makuwa TaxID=1194695 RepID=A0A5D3DAC9_CUCMM|nr:putative serine/threonine-protein kinase nek2 [Cucumis melo var. makuwa]
MKVLKNYVRNRHHPEGCIAESYIVEEAIEFCSDFLFGVDPIGLRIDRLDASLDNSSFGRPLSAEFPSNLNKIFYTKLIVFRCDWVENNNGMKIDDLGFVLVDLKRIGHKYDSFLMATQARQVFYVEDPSDARWSIVLTPPQRDCEDQSNDDELGDIMLHCQGVPSDMPNIDGGNDLGENMIFSLHMEPMIVRDDQDKEVGGAEIDGLVVGVVDEHVEKPKQQRKRGPMIIFDVTRVRSEGERKLVEYNEDGVPTRENEAKLNSFIGSCVHYHIPIIYATWIDVPAELKEKIYTIVEAAFIIDSRSMKSILKTARIALCQFKHWLTKKYILPFKNEPELLKRPPYMYSYIDQKQWEEFVRFRLCPHFEDKRKLQQERRKKNKYNHILSRKEESELDRASIWKKARVDKKGQYDNEDVQEVDEISKTCVDKEPSPNDVLTQALGTRESSGRVLGVSGKTCVLREDIIDFCNMREVKTLTLVAYMAYLHSQDELSNYIFVDPSLISVGHNTQEVRARNLCSRLMALKPNQLVLAPFSPGVITIFRSQKNIQTSRKQPIWKTMKCPLQVGVVECGYYVMRYMRDILTNGSIVVTDLDLIQSTRVGRSTNGAC